MPEVDSTEVRCPTCRARQAWSDTCRRCKCDLRLLRAADRAYREHQKQCLLALRAGRSHAALRHARICARLSGNDESHRLLAVCALLAGDWPTALSLAGDPNHFQRRQMDGTVSGAHEEGETL